MKSHVERFWSKVDRRPDGCWMWIGTVGTNGYGRFHLDRKEVPAHRFSYELQVGPIPDGLTIDHLCRVPLCVNPEHMEPVTVQENLRRGFSPSSINRVKTACLRGHPFDDANTYMFRGTRKCRTCRRADASAYRRRQQIAKAAAA